MRWWLMLMAVLATGCLRPCGPDSCGGCCTDLGECLDGTARLECGSRGSSCTACKSSERCVSSGCEALPMVDAGIQDSGVSECKCVSSCCLANGQCSPNNGIDACGPPLQWCGTCASAQRCERGMCVAARCSGCFDPLGACRSGLEVGACGPAGGICVSCGEDQTCRNGTCAFTRCDVSTCRFGCCQSDNRCETNIGVLSCGIEGSACITCAPDKMCLGGQCQ
jgi:hypothetical protein